MHNSSIVIAKRYHVAALQLRAHKSTGLNKVYKSQTLQVNGDQGEARSW